MKTPIVSRSAFNVALHRAIHQVCDLPVVFNDPYAVKIIDRSYDISFSDPLLYESSEPGTRAAIVARSLFAENCLIKSMERGVRQYVIIGAGLDTSSFRINDTFPDVTCFELDKPDVQSWKSSLLSSAGIGVPEKLNFVPMDLEKDDLFNALGNHGFNSGLPACYTLLGVAPLIRKSAVLELLELISRSARESEIIMDYAMEEALLSPEQKRYRKETIQKMADIGENMQCFFNPADLRADMAWMGYSDIIDLGFREVNDKYFAHRQDKLKVSESGRRLLRAVV